MDRIDCQLNSSLGYSVNKTKQDQIQLPGWNYLYHNQRLLEDINDNIISKLTIAKISGKKLTQVGLRKTNLWLGVGTQMGEKSYMMKKKLASARKIMNLIILQSRISEKLYELKILIGKTIRLDKGQGQVVNWHNTGLFTLEQQETHRCAH